MNIINILGINISTLNQKQVLEKIEQFLTDNAQHQIVTPNPEFILEAGHNEEFFYILNKADLAIPDGIGLKFAGWAMGKNIRRITGADLVKYILQIAQDKKLKIAVLNWRDGLSSAEDIKNAVKKLYPELNFIVKDIDRENFVETQNFVSLQEFHPDILFVALGAPWQEKFIYHALTPSPRFASLAESKRAGEAGSPSPISSSRERGGIKLPSVKVAIGIGGAFDFLTGKIKRAPKLLRIVGMEWLWRLIKQPWRWKRIYNAVIVFPWKFFKWRFICPFLYRPNVACLLYKRVIKLAPATSGTHANEKKIEYKILLAERRDEPGHWQLPQGGTDGEDLITAGVRELSEEIGCDKFRPTACFSNLWKYKFNKKAGEYKIKRHTGYKGQKQGLFIAEFLGEDQDIKIDFWDHISWKWADSENLINEAHLSRKEAMKIFLEKFKNLQITN